MSDEITTKDAETALTTAGAAQRDVAVMPGFSSNSSWELAQRIAKAFALSNLVPATYQGNLPNCLIALEMANRMGASPLMVMQNLYIVHGRPAWSTSSVPAACASSARPGRPRSWKAPRPMPRTS